MSKETKLKILIFIPVLFLAMILIIAAHLSERDGHTVELKSFRIDAAGRATTTLLHDGTQNDVLIEEQEPGRELFLAVPDDVWNGLLAEPQSQKLIVGCALKFITYRAGEEEIVQWTS